MVLRGADFRFLLLFARANKHWNFHLRHLCVLRCIRHVAVVELEIIRLWRLASSQ